MRLLGVVGAFWIGSIPFGVLLAGRRGVDIRHQGSGNIGAANVTRVLGLRAGLIVLVLDSTKGALPTWFALHHAAPWTVASTGLAAILGHCFSPWLKWRGGKGVATALGVFAVLSPLAALVALGVFAVVFAATRVPALGSLAGAVAIAVVLMMRGPAPYAWLAVAITGLLVWTHRSNLRGLKTRAR
ncbi:MAG TPA: glycerol-3-phosphate acyltransferase [Candidatus Udaeobacter sp.]|nr:glycerol-3-phosphate acyltransferase [Candidatus Udaeobacter sp.]